MANIERSDSGGQNGFYEGGQYNAYGGYVQSGYEQNIQYTDDGYVQDHGYDAEPESDVNFVAQGPGFVSKSLNLFGAVASLALVVGIGVWGYKLVIRDVSGVPVVRAVEGPMRVQPVDPGGKEADHQGLAVNAVAAQGTAARPADTLKLAPKPVTLSDEDAPLVESQTTPKAEVTEVKLAEPTPAEPVGDSAISAFQNGQVDALVNELTAGIPALMDDPAETDQPEQSQTAAVGIVQPEPLSPLDISDVPEAQPAVYQGPGLSRSLRPVSRPARSNESQAIEAALRSATDATASLGGLDVDPESLPAGTRLAQLGAFESPEVAKAEWERLYGRFGDFLDGKQRVIQMASSGGRTFYRLRAMGFDDLSDARRFCSALVAGNAECIPVTTR
ncbi:MAG: SPOR domain-containing protein [Paracoccaceae bacterium]|jgi:hypothetical protein